MYVVEDVTHRQLTLKKLYLHWETSLIFALNVFTLLSSSTNKRIIPELFVLTLQIDVDCTSYFDTDSGAAKGKIVQIVIQVPNLAQWFSWVY